MSDFLLPTQPTKLPDGCKLIHADCFDVLREMKDGEVDHTITDPPYAEKTHAGARGARPGIDLTVVPIVTFDSISDETFLLLCRELIRVTKRWVVMTCDWRHAAIAEDDGRIPVIRCGVWIKPDAAPQFTGDRPGTGWEAVLMLHREGKKRWNGGGHHAVWEHHVQRNNRHPTEKPLGLIRKWVRQFTDPGETILDPFAGSGTTGEAALLEGRRAYLVEKNSKWCEIARRRLNRPFPKPTLRDRKSGEELLMEFPT